MKLDSVNRPVAMRDGHDHAVVRFRIDAQVLRHRFTIDDERVVARRLHRSWAAGEEPAFFVAHFAELPVNRNAPAHNPRAERFTDGLMAEADAEERNRFVGADQFEDASRARRRSRPRRDDDRLGFLIEQGVDIEPIVAHDLQLERGDPFDLLDQVVRERIVVIDNGDHGKLLNVARGKDGIRRYTIEARLSTGGYSQSDESTGQTVDSFTSRAGTFMARENNTGSGVRINAKPRAEARSTILAPRSARAPSAGFEVSPDVRPRRRPLQNLARSE